MMQWPTTGGQVFGEELKNIPYMAVLLSWDLLQTGDEVAARI